MSEYGQTLKVGLETIRCAFYPYARPILMERLWELSIFANHSTSKSTTKSYRNYRTQGLDSGYQPPMERTSFRRPTFPMKIGGDRRRGVGRYVSRCEIPGNLLNQGIYLVTVGGDIPYVESFFIEQSVIRFEVEQTGGPGSHDRRQMAGCYLSRT